MKLPPRPAKLFWRVRRRPLFRHFRFYRKWSSRVILTSFILLSSMPVRKRTTVLQIRTSLSWLCVCWWGVGASWCFWGISLILRRKFRFEWNSSVFCLPCEPQHSDVAALVGGVSGRGYRPRTSSIEQHARFSQTSWFNFLKPVVRVLFANVINRRFERSPQTRLSLIMGVVC